MMLIMIMIVIVIIITQPVSLHVINTARSNSLFILFLIRTRERQVSQTLNKGSSHVSLNRQARGYICICYVYAYNMTDSIHRMHYTLHRVM